MPYPRDNREGPDKRGYQAHYPLLFSNKKESHRVTSRDELESLGRKFGLTFGYVREAGEDEIINFLRVKIDWAKDS